MARREENNCKYMCDFETVNNPNDCRVWAWAATIIGRNFDTEVGVNIDSFMKWLFSKNSPTIYFHNAKFDTDFILNWLFQNGYEWNNLKAPKRSGTFTTLIADNGTFYALKIFPKNSKTYITIYDSYKLIALPVAKIPKAFGLKAAKTTIDYDLYRAPGQELTLLEEIYVVLDCMIVAKALHIMFSKELYKMTAASNAMTYYIDLIGGKQFDRWFPSDPESDPIIRNAYYGGAVMVNPLFQGKIVSPLRIYDVNSHFPAQLRYQLMPYGVPKKFTGKYPENRIYPLYVQTITFSCRLKEGHLPVIPSSKGFIKQSNEWLISTEEEVKIGNEITKVDVQQTYTLTNIDLEMLFEHYDVFDETYQGGYMFKAQRGMFDKYIDYWMGEKERAVLEKNKGYKYICKLFLNSFYGKFGTNPLKGQKEPYYQDGKVCYRDLDKKLERPIYVAVAAFTTAYARQITLGVANKFIDRFVYCDTDSIHLIGNEVPEGMDIDPARLGAWDNEYNAECGIYLHAKCYCDKNPFNPETGKPLKDDNGNIIELVIKCAGMTEAQKATIKNINDFKVGLELDGKLVPERVSGGTILKNTTFKIKEKVKKRKVSYV